MDWTQFQIVDMNHNSAQENVRQRGENNTEGKHTCPLLQLKYVSRRPTHSLDIQGLFSPAHSLNDRFWTYTWNMKHMNMTAKKPKI